MKTYLFALLSLLSSCEREEKLTPEQVPFVFQVPLTISPSKDTVSVGDTLWLKASFPDTVREFYSGAYYQITPNRFDWKTSIAFRQLVYPNQYISNQLSAANKFIYVNKIGSITPKITFADLNYVYINNKYNCRIGIIPQQKGVYHISVDDKWESGGGITQQPDYSFINLTPNSDGRPRSAYFQANYYYINTSNANFYLVKRNSLYTSFNYPSTSNINIEQEASYTFVVR